MHRPRVPVTVAATTWTRAFTTKIRPSLTASINVKNGVPTPKPVKNGRSTNPMVLHESYIKEQIQKLEDLIKKHGANPEADGMLHALVWVINPRTIPVPSAYAELLYGI